MRKTIILRVILMVIILGILAYLVYVAFNAKSTTEDSMVMESNTEETNGTEMVEEVNNDNLENMNEENLNNESGDENMVATTTAQWEGEYSYSKIEEGVTDDGEKHYTLKIMQDGDTYNVVYTYSGMHLEEYETTAELTGDVLSAVLKSEPRTNLIDEPKIGDKMFTLEMAKDGKMIELKWVFNPEWEPVTFYRVME